MHFGAPQNFWLLLLVPMLGLFFAWAIASKGRALERFVSSELAPKLTRNLSRGRQSWKYALLVGGVLFLVLSLTSPRFGAKLAMAQRKGVDVVIVLDVSRSMLAQDVKPSRLRRAKYLIGRLLDRLPGDRAGLVVFAGEARIRCPLTLDHEVLRTFLDVVDTSAIPVQGTAIGDALVLAASCFEDGERRHKAVVLFTDGEEHVGEPLEAAERIAAEGVRVFAVGMGTEGGELIPGQNDSGGLNYHKDARGQYVKTRLDEAVLEQIAMSTEGDYFRSSLGGRELEALHEQISGMDEKEFGSLRFTRYEERFQIPLLLALLCFMAEAWMSDRRRVQGQWQGRFS